MVDAKSNITWSQIRLQALTRAVVHSIKCISLFLKTNDPSLLAAIPVVLENILHQIAWPSTASASVQCKIESE